jgi:hypothetical protein
MGQYLLESPYSQHDTLTSILAKSRKFLVTVQVGQMIMLLPAAGMPGCLWAARKAPLHPAKPPHTQP